jgi:predicted acetyltransferase
MSLFGRLQAKVPGVLTRSEAWWSHRVFADIEEWREGRSALRFAVHEDEGEPTGYVMYRQKAKWDDFIAKGEVSVDELVALDPRAHVGLWGFLTNVDLFPEVSAWNVPVDDPLPLVVAEHRRVRRTLADALWVRIMDVESALGSRTYEDDGEVTFELVDAARPDTSGTYRLVVRDGVGECRRVSGSGQVTFESDVLGHLYLGGGSALAMAAARRITGEPDAVVTLHRLMRTMSAPWCPEVF